VTLTSDDLESHVVVNVSSTLTNNTIWYVATYVGTYGWIFLQGLLGHLSGDDLKTEIKTQLQAYNQTRITYPGCIWLYCVTIGKFGNIAATWKHTPQAIHTTDLGSMITNLSKSQWAAVASAGPYANHHIAPGR